MTAAQVLVAVCVACLGLACGQLYNGYINPLFLPRGLRAGRYLDADLYNTANPYSSNPYSANLYSSNPYARQQDLDYRRGLLDPRYEVEARRYGGGLDRLYGDGLSRRVLPEDLRYLQLLRAQNSGIGLGLASTAQPALDRDRGLFDRNQQLLDRLGTASPEQLSVTVTPNSST